MTETLAAYLEQQERRKQRDMDDAREYAENDPYLCMLCRSTGTNRRSFLIHNGEDVRELIPEALSLYQVAFFRSGHPWLRGSFYLNICRDCHTALLDALGQAAAFRRSLSGTPLDSDGNVIEDEEA